MKNIVLTPNSVYEIGKDIPTGYYLFFHCKEHQSSFFYGDDPEAASIYIFTSPSIRSCTYGNFGVIRIANDVPWHKYVQIENGVAVYYGENKVDICDLLQTANVADGDYSDSAVPVFESALLKISILRKDSPVYTYTGETDALLWEQYWFSVNSEVYWLGSVRVLTCKGYGSLEFCMQDPRASKSFVFSGQETGLPRGYIGSNGFVCRLPKDFSATSSNIEWIKPSFVKTGLYYTEKSINEIHADEFSRMEEVLGELNELGISVDAKKELDFFLSVPDLMRECISFFEKNFNAREKFLSKRIPKHSKIRFVVRATFDKQYYCAARLADSAETVEFDNKRNLFYVTFKGSQIEEIALMYHNLANIVNEDRKDLLEANEHLKKYDYLTFLQNATDSFIIKRQEKYGYSGKVTGSVLISTIKGIKKARKEKLHDLYLEMGKQGRVQSKWSSEYSLYVLIRRYVPDALYQYRCDWLGQQSFDIYIPSQKIAVEYQGKQHFESVSFFGGEESMEDNLSRDRRKKHLAEENDIAIFYWDYALPVNKENVVAFLAENHIDYSIEKATDTSIVSGAKMAPPTKLSKPSSTHQRTSYVVQYSLEGKFIEKYSSINAAAQASGAGVSSISKVLAAQRNSAGRFVWRRFKSDDIPNEISINFDVSKINDGGK